MGKKEQNLSKTLEDLQHLSSFTHQWQDLEDHMNSIRKLIDDRLNQLQSNTNNKSLSSSECVTHPELKTLCLKMDGLALRSYIAERHSKDVDSIREELGVALNAALDPGKLVLDAMQGFYPANHRGDKDGELAVKRRSCILLLEELLGIGLSFSHQVKEAAKKVAVEWKGKVSSGGEYPLETLGLLQLVATYGLTSAFHAHELVDLAAKVSRRKQTIDLLRALGLADKVPDFIEKLTIEGKHVEAVKFIYAFELVDKFPPIPLLKAYQAQSKKVAQGIRNKGNKSAQALLNESIVKELAAVKAIIKCLAEHNLESEYPRSILDKRVEQLEKQKADRKRPAAASAPASNKQQQSGNKRPRQEAHDPVSSTVPLSFQPRLQPASSFMDRVDRYVTSSAQYGLVGSTPSVASYITSSPAGTYGLGPNPLSFGGGRSPPRSYLHSSELHLPAGLYDRSMGLGSHAMPPSYRSSYYP